MNNYFNTEFGLLLVPWRKKEIRAKQDNLEKFTGQFPQYVLKKKLIDYSWFCENQRKGKYMVEGLDG